MRTAIRATFLAGALLAQLSALGCTPGDREPDDPASPTTPSESRTSPSSSTTATKDAACARLERTMVGRSAYPLQQAVDAVMVSPAGRSRQAADRIRARAERIQEALDEQCDAISPPAQQYLRTAHEVSRTPLTHPGLNSVVADYTRWARAVDKARSADQLQAAMRGCRELKRKVSSSYRVWWRWSDTGRVWWIEQTFRSDLDRPLDGGLSGGVRVSALTERLWYPDGKYSGIARWGGSSADFVTIRPGTTQKLIAPMAGPYVAVGPGGEFDVQSVELTVGVPGVRSWWCSLPVPERP